MTKQEFQDRTHMCVTEEDFVKINESYMNTDLEKDLFRKLYVENPEALKELENQTLMARELADEKNELADFLIEQAQKYNSHELRHEAVSILGKREYMRRVLDNGYAISNYDRELIYELLYM